jgi:hypothetical protein
MQDCFTTHRLRKAVLPLVVMPGLLAVPSFVRAQNDYATPYASPRQYYSDWKKYPTADSYYRDYYFKPTPSYAGYKHHFVVLTAAHPDHCYFYNPYRKVYWGRCDTYCQGQPTYSHLEPEYQKENLSEIPDSAFPTSGGLPPIPESKDGAKLDLPPDDLPAGFPASSRAQSAQRPAAPGAPSP